MRKFALFWILILSFQAFAQSEFGSITGQFTDATGAVIPNAQVKATPVIDGKIVEEKSLKTNTNDDGEFSFLNIPIGKYEIQIKVSWSEIVIKKQINVTNGKSAKAFLGFTSYTIEACSDVTETKDLTTATDKSEIIKEMVSKFPNARSKPILSTKNLKKEWLIEIKQKFRLMKQGDIQYQADTKADFEYYKFSTFKVKGTCVEISFDYVWAVGRNSKFVYLSGNGETYEFRKKAGKWTKKFVSGWVS